MYLLNNTANRTVIVNNKEHLFFSGYSYLGIHHHPNFKRKLQENIENYGLFFPSSRISNTQLNIYNKVEDFLNQHFNKLITPYQTALFGNGFLSGLAAQKLFNLSEKTFVAPNTHPAISNDFNYTTRDIWIDQLLNDVNKNKYSNILIKSDSVDVLKSEINDFSFLKQINSICKIDVLIDDSHGIGLIGNNGSGIVSFLPKLKNVQYHFNYSLSKSYGIPAGAFSSSSFHIEQIKQLPEFSASTPPIPLYLQCFIDEFATYNQQRILLENNIQYFARKTAHISLKNNPDLPIFILNKNINQEIFKDHNIIISSFSYPTENGEKYNRIVLNSLHTQQDLDYLIRVLQKALA